MSRRYAEDKTLRKFIRCVVALAFLPCNEIETVLDQLREMEMDKESPYYEEMKKFQERFCDYFQSTWIRLAFFT